MKRLANICLTAFCLLLAAGTQQATAQAVKGTLWRDAVVTKLDVDFADTGFHARWIFQRCQCGDLLVQVEQVAPGSVLHGELLMVDGQVLLARGFEQPESDLAALMQAPALMLQLAFALLNRSQPQGPATVTDKQQWDASEANREFSINTGAASGTFAAPWRVQGSGWRTAADLHRFDLGFQFTNPVPDNPAAMTAMRFSGALDYHQQAFPLPDSTSLQGWTIQWLSRGETESREISDSLTLKELRQQTKNP